MAEPLLGKPPRRGSRLPWRRPGGVLALVCTFTAFLTFKPSEPYLVVFLNCVRSVPHSTIVNSIFPAWTYAQLALLPLLATASELIGYRFVVLCGMAGRNATLLILIFGGSSVALLTLSQVTIAAGFAAHPALVAILFRSLPSESYARAVGMVSASGVLAEVLSSFVGQLMVNRGIPLLHTIYISFASTTLATLLAVLLPSPRPPLKKKARHAGGLGVGLGPPQLPPVGVVSLEGGRGSFDHNLLDQEAIREVCRTPSDGGTLGTTAVAPAADLSSGPCATEERTRNLAGDRDSTVGQTICNDPRSTACSSAVASSGVDDTRSGDGVVGSRDDPATGTIAPLQRAAPLAPLAPSPPLHDALINSNTNATRASSIDHDVTPNACSRQGKERCGCYQAATVASGSNQSQRVGGGIAGSSSAVSVGTLLVSGAQVGRAAGDGSRRHMVSDVFRAFSRSGALKYYAWLAVATAVHHLVFTYWQALKGIHHGDETMLAPSPPTLVKGHQTPTTPPSSRQLASLLAVGSVSGSPLSIPERLRLAPGLEAASPLALMTPPPPPPCGVSSRHNGWVSLAASMLGGVAALLPLLGERHLSEAKCSLIRAALVIGAPLALASLLYIMAVTAPEGERLSWAYDASFVSYHVLHELMRVVCDAEGARCVARTSYRGAPRFALVGGLATTATLVLQSAAQMLVSKPGFGLSLDLQFKVLAAMLVALFVFCAVAAVVNCAARVFGWTCVCCPAWTNLMRRMSLPGRSASLPAIDVNYERFSASGNSLLRTDRAGTTDREHSSTNR